MSWKNLKIGKSPEKNYYLGENLANRRLGNSKKIKRSKIQKNQKDKNTKKIEKQKSTIDENLVNRRHGSKKRFLPRR